MSFGFKRWIDMSLSNMGYNKFVTVFIGTIASGLAAGLVLFNVIPDDPQQIIVQTQDENTTKKENDINEN